MYVGGVMIAQTSSQRRLMTTIFPPKWSSNQIGPMIAEPSKCYSINVLDYVSTES